MKQQVGLEQTRLDVQCDGINEPQLRVKMRIAFLIQESQKLQQNEHFIQRRLTPCQSLVSDHGPAPLNSSRIPMYNYCATAYEFTCQSSTSTNAIRITH